MPFCGFNQEMLEGLEKFHTALAERFVMEPGEKILINGVEIKEGR